MVGSALSRVDRADTEGYFRSDHNGYPSPPPEAGQGARSGSGFPVGDTTYRFVQVKPDRFFGGGQRWIGEVRVPITDLERTLLDGLSMARYCGDFAEVLHAVQVGMDRLNIELIAEYAVRLGVTTAKRLGWVLESQGVPRSELAVLAELPVKGYCKLDPSGPRKGACNSRWMVQENLPGMVEA